MAAVIMKPSSVTALSRGYCRDTAMDHTRNCDSYVGKGKQSYSPVSVRVEGRQHANTDIVNAATVRENTPAMSAPRNAPYSPGQHLDLPSSFERSFSQDSRNISLLRSSAPPKKHGTWCRFKKSLKSMFGRGPSPKPPPSFASHRASVRLLWKRDCLVECRIGRYHWICANPVSAKTGLYGLSSRSKIIHTPRYSVTNRHQNEDRSPLNTAFLCRIMTPTYTFVLFGD